MRLLILSQFYHPEPETIPHIFARGMVERGHEVTVITGLPNYPTGKVFPQYRGTLYRHETLDSVEVHRLPLFPDHTISARRRITYYLSLAASAATMGPLVARGVDMIWVYHTYTLGFVAWWLGLIRSAPFIFDVADMYPESLSVVGLSPSSLAWKGVNRLADFVYRHAAMLTVISDGFKTNLIGKGVPAEKVQVLPNWADEDLYRPVPYDERLADEFGMRGKFNVVYAGSMGPPQGLSNVIEAAARLKHLPQIRIFLIGDGVERTKLQAKIQSLGLTNVELVPRQPEHRMPGIYALADALLVHLAEDPVFDITVPSKTQCYLACGRPLLMCVKGDGARIVEAARAGLTVRQSAPDDLASKIRCLAAMGPEARAQMGSAGRAFYLAHFTKKRRLDAFDKLFRDLTFTADNPA